MVFDVTEQQKNTGWAWIVVCGSFLIQFIQAGFFLTVGILYVDMKTLFSIDSTDVSWIGGLQTGFLYLAAPIVTINVDRFTPRTITIAGAITVSTFLLVSSFVNDYKILYLTLGVIPGIGFSMTHLASLLILNDYFSKKLSIAIGISRGSVGLGMAVFGPLIRYLLQRYSFKGTLLLLSGIVLHCVIGGAVFYPIIGGKTTNTRKERKGCREAFVSMCEVRLIADIEFLLFLSSNVFASLGYWAPIAFLPDQCISIGYSFSEASSIVTIVGILFSTGQIFYGFMSQRFAGGRSTIFGFSTLMIAVSLACIPSCTTLTSLAVSSSVFGFLTGGWSCMTVILTVDLFGSQRMSRTLGIVVFIQGVGSLAGVPLSTYLSAVLNMDVFLYYFSAGMYLLSFIFFLPLTMKCFNRKNGFHIGEDSHKEKEVKILLDTATNDDTYRDRGH